MDWKCGSSGGASALQVQGSELKPQSCPKNYPQKKKKVHESMNFVSIMVVS
jgi:hypothetical protein